MCVSTSIITHTSNGEEVSPATGLGAQINIGITSIYLEHNCYTFCLLETNVKMMSKLRAHLISVT